jgi:prevent-host-death family protein
MRCSTHVTSISYLKANATEVLAQLTSRREPMLITQNGEARAVLQDVASYEETQETLALLKILALGIKECRQTAFKPYRVIHRVTGQRVIIYLIADVRRDMQSVLSRRLLGA